LGTVKVVVKPPWASVNVEVSLLALNRTLTSWRGAYPVPTTATEESAAPNTGAITTFGFTLKSALTSFPDTTTVMVWVPALVYGTMIEVVNPPVLLVVLSPL